MARVTHGIATGNEFEDIELVISDNHTFPSHSGDVGRERGSRGANPVVVQGGPPLPPDVGASDVSVRRMFGIVDVMAITSSLEFLTTSFALKRTQAPQHKVDAWEFAGGLVGIGWAVIKLIPWPPWPRRPPATPTDLEHQALQVHGDDTGVGA